MIAKEENPFAPLLEKTNGCQRHLWVHWATLDGGKNKAKGSGCLGGDSDSTSNNSLNQAIHNFLESQASSSGKWGWLYYLSGWLWGSVTL